MPTLHWIGKEKVINHHLDVPFRVLEHEYGFENGQELKKETNSGNKIIHGDNLEALKSLLPEYTGRVNCIYIDPPYNTGNEGWVYNDNQTDPRIKKWLNKVVGKEGEDLSRHDKWLCMMYPRLKLLHKLLAETGIILISIDDAEISNLKLICDEIFGSANFLTQLIWKRRTSSALTSNNLSVDHEYILCYSKSGGFKFSGTKKSYKNYKNPDNDPDGPWMLDNLTVGMGKDLRPNQYYDLVDPETGVSYKPNPNRVWAYIPSSMSEKISQKRIVFPKNGKGRPMLKRYLKDLKTDINPFSSLLVNDELSIGLNSEGTKVIQNIFGEKIFDYPKPVSLLETVLAQVTSKNDIILDSFAGSGTTGHAVLNLNKLDNGNRSFILVEMEDYAKAITSERIKRVVKGYSNVEGTGGSFDFYSLGEKLFTDSNTINDMLDVDRLRKYIYYSETNCFLNSSPKNDNSYLLNVSNDTAYYLLYKSGEALTLNYDFLKVIRTKAEQYIIYADNCVLTKDFLSRHNIIFKKIPRDIALF